MSDAIQALNEVVFKAGQREDSGIGDKASPVDLQELLKDISVIAGDALEDHVKATDRAKPRKQRVYRDIVNEIAAYFVPVPDTVEGTAHVIEGVAEILKQYNVTTTDAEGRKVTFGNE